MDTLMFIFELELETGTMFIGLDSDIRSTLADNNIM